TGIKWGLMSKVDAKEKYIVCNGDEGDPGAYMNRNESESDPHMLLEGLLIGAYATGSSKGVIYIRAEYPLAVSRLKLAMKQAKECGFLGEKIFGTSFNFDLQLIEGAGAFVCGEETALMHSIEGKSGRPRPRPPFPAQKGILDKPTTINNVETLSNIPVIIAKGADFFLQTGTKTSPGTKVFSLVGKIKNTGLVEMPLGSPLQTIIYNIGEGTGTRRKVKAVQTGGPSGGCIPTGLFNTPVDYESLNSLGAIMGSGGMVVMDDDNCMVDVARYFVEFTNSESCGKCTPCREGLHHILESLNAITDGKARQGYLDELKSLGLFIKDSALCGLGQTGPNPVLTTIKYFLDEYESHAKDKRCEAGVCQNLFVSPCENSCPLHMNISGFLALTKAKKLQEAFELSLRDNPLPASTGRICHFHCKLRCRREDIDSPVSQGEVHRYIADMVHKTKDEAAVYKKILKERLPQTGKKITIIGAGPAGLMAAYYLARLGHNTVIYEKNDQAGGILRYGIPQYRLPRDVLAREIEFIKRCGVKFVFNTIIDSKKLSSIEKKSDAVFLATGAYKEMPLNIPGETLKGVWSGVTFLEEVASSKKPKIGGHVVIVGAGNVAIDAARSAWRLGSKVTIVYRREREDMPANKEEIDQAYQEGINFVFLANPKAVIGDEKGRVRALDVTKMIPGEYDLTGRRKPVSTAEVYEIPCDTVMTAIGERVDADFLRNFGVELDKYGAVTVDRDTLVTRHPKIFAGGDLVTGPSTAVEAMSWGRKFSEKIDYALMGDDKRFKKLITTFKYNMNLPLTIEKEDRQVMAKLKIGRRINNFKEVNLGLSQKQVHTEIRRCLRCDIKES
ncbi:MAG: FAD-dependent oxidoreductase, partial [Candidatus Omnitrophota bacterium]